MTLWRLHLESRARRQVAQAVEAWAALNVRRELDAINARAAAAVEQAAAEAAEDNDRNLLFGDLQDVWEQVFDPGPPDHGFDLEDVLEP